MTTQAPDPGVALILALDQGGHASRAIVFDACGGVVAEATVGIETHTPAADRVEHDPDELVASVDAAIDRALADLGPRAADVCAAGLATQRSSVVCWDRVSGAALSPVLSWQDRRGAAYVTDLRAHAEEVRARTGLVLSPHYGASKLRWCLDHLPAVREAAAARRLAWGPLASFLLFRLLEERPHVIDCANASRTQLWNIRSRTWDPALLRLHGITGEALPECVPSRGRVGHVVRGAHRIPLTVTTGDQPAALFAAGPPETRSIIVNAGTGAFVQRIAGVAPVETSGLLLGVAWCDGDGALHVLEGTVNGAGRAIVETGRELGFASTVAAHDAAVEGAMREGPLPLFLNGVSGLGSPYWVPDFPSRFVGAGTPEERMAAVLESIVFLLAVNIERMVAVGGQCPRLVVSGGLASSDVFVQRLADVTSTLVERAAVGEATARGLAWLVADDPPDWADAPPEGVFTPRPAPALAERFRRWRAEMDDAVRALSPDDA